MSQFLTPGRNCDFISGAERISFLVDGESYFATLRDVIKRAQRTVYILSWDIDSLVSLSRDGVNDGYPVQLGEFLNTVVTKNPELNIYILNWDFAVLFTLDRELLPVYKLDWKTHHRVHFRLNDHLPDGASQHQKIVVIDDTLAFIGGLDLTKGRWDTTDHLPFNNKRDLIGAKPARPYHDIQVLVAGDCARELGNLARQYWLNATRETLPEINPGNITHLWPNDLPVNLSEVMVGIAFTYAEYKNRKQTRQIQQLYIDAISSAKRTIYIENQFFTTPVVGKVIKQQLQKNAGPEIILVTPKYTEGWLAQNTMDVLRARLVKQLKEADKHNRFRVYYPEGPGLDKNPVNVHAKLMIVDDDILTLGSANLNNRSMALDDECNLVIHAEGNGKIQSELTALRHRLIAEHLGCKTENLERALKENNSLISTIETLNNAQNRYLNSLPLIAAETTNQHVPDIEIIDPEHPIEMEKLIKKLIPEEEQLPARKRILIWVGIITVLLVLAGLWQWTPLKQWVEVKTVNTVIEEIRNYPAAPIIIILGFIIAGLVAFPFTLLVIASVIAFGSLWGFMYSLVGGTLSAITTYAIGNIAGRRTVRKLAGERLNRISKKLAQHGILTILTIRIVPVAPFTIINLVAGASHIQFRDYFLGTVLGMAPGMLAITILIDRVDATIKEPNVTNAAILAVAIGLVVLGAFGLIRWLMKRTKEENPGVNQ